MTETADSFFIGADVFYTFLVQNGLWWIKQRQKEPGHYLDGLPLARHQILNGRFPAYITQQFEDLLKREIPELAGTPITHLALMLNTAGCLEVFAYQIHQGLPVPVTLILEEDGQQQKNG